MIISCYQRHIYSYYIRSNNQNEESDGKNGQNDHLRPEQKDHPLTGAN